MGVSRDFLSKLSQLLPQKLLESLEGGADASFGFLVWSKFWAPHIERYLLLLTVGVLHTLGLFCRLIIEKRWMVSLLLVIIT